MAERDVEVCGSAAGRLRLRLLGSACDGCSGGCAGRCSLFATNASGEFEMPAPVHLPVSIGQPLRLCLDDASLRRAAWRGYGMAWLGLLLGAGLGFGAGLLWGRHADLLTLLGLVGGTFAAVRSSKACLPEPQLRLPGRPVPFVPSMSDRP
ncbi:MAG: SoxR reducing system RseC family protein [Arenimonas sp.]|uniref:SoxR reducing system RseC family protein n=1 Tax=Arenimonas sp. TaxID=1872635 RepID=UPI0025BF4C6A|nr:SoxR reducing system RseC family protein [Arenimonas sp.]MBW8368545.1 SoxR reducing system RseC family protein [Arenimonas sp.]